LHGKKGYEVATVSGGGSSPVIGTPSGDDHIYARTPHEVKPILILHLANADRQFEPDAEPDAEVESSTTVIIFGAAKEPVSRVRL